MHCSSCASLSSTNDIMSNEEEMQQMRLRKLLEEKILKIEKENLEAVQNELKENFKKSEVQGELKSKHTVKSLINRKVKPNFKEQTSSSTASKKIFENTDQQNCCGKFNNEHSKIHFLNHFQSSLNASKAQLHHQRLETKAKHLPNVPLCRNDFQPAPITLEKLRPSVKKTPNIANTAIHHIASRDKKSLTMQVLPSISIFENKPKVQSNVSLEEIREENIAGCDGVVSTSFPGQSSNNGICFDSFQHFSEAVAPRGSSQQQHPRKSVFTMTNNQLQNGALASNQNQLKTLVKEILYDLHILPTVKQHFDSKKDNISSTEEVPVENSHCKKPGNKMHHCCCHCNKETETVSTQTSVTCSTYTQTDALKPLTTQTEDVRYIVREAMSEYEDIFASIFDARNKLLQLERTRELELCKTDKEVQTILNMEMKAANVYESKEIQTSFTEDNLHQSRSMTPIVEKLNHTASKVVQTLESYEINKQMSQMASKIDSVMNALNDHLCKANDNAAKSLHRSISSPSNTTRDVSLQFSPQVLSRSTCTGLKKITDVGNQCDLLTTSKENPKLVNVSTQISLEEHFQFAEANKRIEAFTQCETYANAVIDSCTQTGEHTPSLQCSDHSNSTSTTSTPVNDTLFVDDNFSEGELPWHLRFLSCHYENKQPSSDILAGSSTPSEERDYSLSEGEVHPSYVQDQYDEHSKKGSRVEFNSETVEDLLSNPYHPYSQMKTHSNQEPSVTSLFEENRRNSSNHLSSGEINPSFNHYSAHHYSTKPNTTVLPKNQFAYKDIPILHPAGSQLAFDKNLKSCSHTSKLSDSTGYRNSCTVHSYEKKFPSASNEKRINVQTMNKKNFKPFGEKHSNSQSPVNWSSLSSLELSNGEIQEETKKQG